MQLHSSSYYIVDTKTSASSRTNWSKICIFGHFGPNIGISGPFCPMPDQKYANKVPRLVFCYVGNKTFDFSSKKKDFLPKNDQIWPKIGIFGWYGLGHAGFFGALLAGRLVVVARGLYLARHLFTLCYFRFVHDIAVLKVSTELPCSRFDIVSFGQTEEYFSRGQLFPVCLPSSQSVQSVGAVIIKFKSS